MWFVSTQPPYGTSMPQSGRRPPHQSRLRLPALAPPDVRYAPKNDQRIAAPRLVAMGQEETHAPQQKSEPFELLHRSGVQLVEQRLSLFQIERVEAFGEPAENRSEKLAGVIPLALIAPKPRHARRRA
jgi:hypothetical protein